MVAVPLPTPWARARRAFACMRNAAHLPLFASHRYKNFRSAQATLIRVRCAALAAPLTVRARARRKSLTRLARFCTQASTILLPMAYAAKRAASGATLSRVYAHQYGPWAAVGNAMHRFRLGSTGTAPTSAKKSITSRTRRTAPRKCAPRGTQNGFALTGTWAVRARSIARPTDSGTPARSAAATVPKEKAERGAGAKRALDCAFLETN